MLIRIRNRGLFDELSTFCLLLTITFWPFREDGEQAAREEQVAAFNLFICLVAKYFDQSDLVDLEP